MYIKGNEITISRALVFHSRSHVKVSSRCCCVVSLRSGRDDTRPRPRRRKRRTKLAKKFQINWIIKIESITVSGREGECGAMTTMNSSGFFYSNSQQTSFLAEIWYFYNSFAWIVNCESIKTVVLCVLSVNWVSRFSQILDFIHKFLISNKTPFCDASIGIGALSPESLLRANFADKLDFFFSLFFVAAGESCLVSVSSRRQKTKFFHWNNLPSWKFLSRVCR